MHVTVTAGRSERGSARWRIFQLIARLFSKALERSRQRRALSALPPHLLHDIGLMRSDFDRWGDANDPVTWLGDSGRRHSAILPRCDDGHTDREE